MLHAAIARPEKVIALIGIATAADGLVTQYHALPVEVSHEPFGHPGSTSYLLPFLSLYLFTISLYLTRVTWLLSLLPYCLVSCFKVSFSHSSF